MAQHKAVNFGYFLRAQRERTGLSRTQFIEKTGIRLSERRLWQVEMSMPEPRMQIQKLDAIARALGYDRNGLDRAWRSTPVAAPEDERKSRAKNELEAISSWLSDEGRRLNLNRAEMARRLVGLLNQFSEMERDRLYEQGSPGKGASPASHAMRIPRPGKDARLRPAAKTIGGKPRS